MALFFDSWFLSVETRPEHYCDNSLPAKFKHNNVRHLLSKKNSDILLL